MLQPRVVSRSLRFREYLETVRVESARHMIPTIDPEDGAALYALAAMLAATRGRVTAVDAGAGVGYSSLWIGEGLESSCLGECRLVSIEWSRSRAEEARRILGGAGWRRVRVDVVHGDALEWLEAAEPDSITLAFIDVEKDDYPRALELLREKLEPGGVAAFHNAFFPAPPPEFFELASRPPWVGGVLPSPAGLYILVKPGKG